MRQKILSIVTVIIFVITVLAGYFREDLRGFWAAFGTPPSQISNLIKNNQSPLDISASFSVSIFADRLNRPRTIIFDPQGNLLVANTGADEVLILSNNDQNDISDKNVSTINGLNSPHGLALDCDQSSCQLYIAETDQLTVRSYDANTKQTGDVTKLLDLPTGGRHSTKSLMFHPQNQNILLISIGSSCDTCFESDVTRATIQQLDLSQDELTLEPFAVGLRNSVFLTTNPYTQEIWATEMGRDNLGDDLPPDEINIIKEGGNYGWPLCYGKNVHDKQFDKDLYTLSGGLSVCESMGRLPSLIDIPAHSAPLGLHFIEPDSPLFEVYPYDLLVSLHGSWNRTEPTGYKVVRYDFDANMNLVGVHDFMTGWLDQNGTSLGRPVGIDIDQNGNIYISDDKAGVIYRLSYHQNNPDTTPAQTGNCRATGCSSELCADRDLASPCVFRPEFECYREAICGRSTETNTCEWQQTEKLTQCLQQYSSTE